MAKDVIDEHVCISHSFLCSHLIAFKQFYDALRLCLNEDGTAYLRYSLVKLGQEMLCIGIRLISSLQILC